MAHEILHCFGAYDYYYSSNTIPQEYIDYLYSIDSQDIMLISYDMYEITLELTPTDAYYIGLTDKCEDLYEWGLGPANRFYND